MNPGKFQFMILGKSLRSKDCLTVGPVNVKESGHAELLRIPIEKNLILRSTLRIYVGMRITDCMLLDV